MREYGLIGYPLDHAFSRTYFTEKFEKEGVTDAKYHLFPLAEIAKLRKVLEAHPKLYGLNVTTPYKELVIPYLDDLDPVAFSIGAVNTIVIEHHSEGFFLKGYNTDVLGIDKTCESLNLPSKSLILGSGGSARAVRHSLKLQGLSGLTVTRHPSFDDHLGYDELNKHIIQEHKLIVNCTPVGMYPNVNRCPEIPFEFLTKEHICIDLIYNPKKTLFLQRAEAKGAIIKNGFEMLIEQADRAWDIWEKAYEKMQISSKV
ncbi:MAG: shikimate dehydrogenase [Bacteroidales bacterium]|nr:shikimate dehydrogenase [Bacteroidales bacterium]